MIPNHSPYFYFNIHLAKNQIYKISCFSMPTQVSQLTHSDLSERLKNHLKDKDLSKKHKDILASRFHQIKSWGLQNYQKKPTDIDDFLKSIDEMIVSIGTPSLLPDYPSLAPEIAKIYGLLFKTVPSFKELLSEKNYATISL